MQISGKTLLYGMVALMVLLGCGAIYVAAKKQAYEKSIIELQNQIAERDKTIEVQKGVYEKLTLQLNDLKGALDQRDAQVRALEDDLKKKKEELLDATTVAINWKKAYEAEVKGHQSDVPPVKPGDPTRTKVEFEKDFGYIGVKGYTLTNPPDAWVHVQQNRPLKVTLAISQDKQKVWHTYATSSEDNVGVDIQLTGVNPYLLKPKWYEGIGITTDLGVGTNAGGVAALVGLGVNYKIKQFTFGPSMWIGASDRIDKYYGLNFTWRPFERN